MLVSAYEVVIFHPLSKHLSIGLGDPVMKSHLSRNHGFCQIVCNHQYKMDGHNTEAYMIDGGLVSFQMKPNF